MSPNADDVLERLEAMEQAATPVPWVVYNAPRPGIDQAGEYGRNVIYASKFAGEFAGVGRAEDAALIATARNTYPEALAVVRAVAAYFEALDLLNGAHEARLAVGTDWGRLTADHSRTENDARKALAAFLGAAKEAV